MKNNILFFPRTMGLGGTENVVLQLCEIMKSENYNIVVCSCGGVNVEKLGQMGIKHYLIPDIERKNPNVVYEVLKTVARIIKTENITIIHTHHRMAAFYACILLKKYKFTFINTAHNTFYSKKLLTKFSYKHAHLIAVGDRVKSNLCDFYKLPEKQVTVIHNSIKPFEGNIQEIELLNKYRKKGYFLVGNVGRLSEQKGMKYYIEAAVEVLRECPKIKFFIIGDGEDKEKIEKLINDMNLTDDVIMLGFRDDIQSVMSQLDLLVLSSLWEGLPLTPIEAFSVGKTIIATRVDGTVEIIDDDINGMLVDPKNSKQIAEKIIELYNSPDKIKVLEKAACDKYLDKFCYKGLKKKYSQYYKELLPKN